MGNKIICIGREFGSGGHEIAVRLGQELNRKVYEKNLIHLACNFGELAVKDMEHADEKATNPYLYQTVHEGNYHVTRGLPTSEVLYDLQSQQIRRIASEESCIFVGRCADFVLKDTNATVLSVFGKLGFNGLIVTDASHMVGITGKVRRSEFIPQMLMAGCDMILYYRNHDEDVGFLKKALEDGRLTQERLDEAVHTVLAFKASRGLHRKQAEGKLMPPKEGLRIIGCEKHKAKAAEIIDKSITLVKNTRDQLPLTPEKHKRIIIYTVQSGGLTQKIKQIAHGGKGGSVSQILAEELRQQGFEPTVYKINFLKYLSPHGINGKKALAEVSVGEFAKMYDAAIVLCNVGSFSTTNERSLHWTIPMGPEIPWYATEIPTVAISLAHPFHLIDLAMVPTYINTYDGSKEAIHQTVLKLTGKSEFRGVSPVDAFCDRWDTHL